MRIREYQRQRLAKYIECEEAILAGAQSYTIGNRTYTRADLEDVQSMIDALIDAGVTLEDEPLKNGRYRKAVFVE